MTRLSSLVDIFNASMWHYCAQKFQMDALSRILALIPVSGTLDVRCHFGEPWRIEEHASEEREIRYHVLLRGTARVEDNTAEPLSLRPGDIILFPSGTPHVLHDGSGNTPMPQTEDNHNRVSVVTNGSSTPTTDLLCGRFRIPASSQQLLLNHLPSRLVVRGIQDEESGRGMTEAVVASSRLARLIELMREEAIEQGLGSDAMLNHLSGALFSLTLRLGGLADAAPKGLLALARSKPLQPALRAMLEQPEVAWSLPRLADLCSMSRATFIRRFDSICGCSAIDLLTEIRMTMAGRQLVATQMSIAVIGEAVGYQSEAAFQRVFKKHVGVTPARWRALAREQYAS